MRFGVSAASVSRWRAREREQGEALPKTLGGDRRSQRIEACHEAVMAALGPDRDANIEGSQRQALGSRGLVLGFGTLQRFFARTPSRVKTLARVFKLSRAGDLGERTRRDSSGRGKSRSSVLTGSLEDFCHVFMVGIDP